MTPMVMFNTIQPAEKLYPHKLRRLYWPFLALAEACREVVGTVAGAFESQGNRYTVPRFVYRGPATKSTPIRLGLFALIHGDEPAGAFGLQRFLQELADDPAPAMGYELAVYPLCNPTGYEDGTRHNRAGLDLVREFWRGSTQPEVRIIEDELTQERYDGIIAVHTDDTSDGLNGSTQGRVLNGYLLAPALRASAHVLPINPDGQIDGLAAEERLIENGLEGILARLPGQKPRPFEIVFKTPAAAPPVRQAEAVSCALQTVLKECRSLIDQGVNP